MAVRGSRLNSGLKLPFQLLANVSRILPAPPNRGRGTRVLSSEVSFCQVFLIVDLHPTSIPGNINYILLASVLYVLVSF